MFQLRPATFPDLDAIYTLVAQQNTADFGSALLSLEELRQRWHAPDFSLAKQTQVAISAADQIVAYAELRPYHPTELSLRLYLPPTPFAPELGQRLLAAFEADLEPGTELMTQVSGKNIQNQQIFAAAGFKRGLTFLMMEIELTEAPPAPVWPEGIGVRPFIPNHDEQATYATDEAASLDKGYSNPLSFDAWAKRMSLHTDPFDSTLWFLACHQAEVVGVALNFFLPDDNCGVIDHLGVRREWRGRGIGLALLQHSFAAFFARGVTNIKLNVDSGSLTNAPRLYEKAGMQTVQTYHIYSKTII
ncbi:MAG: GNAT family N-acetyltransferase [Anaerolineaceae bacterium]|nr:GNAT family N-acetyltransferase [Anaerolineaceae bacterium]